MNHFIKQSPITGLAGFGGGSSGLTVSGGGVSAAFAGGDRGIAAGGRISGNVEAYYIDYITISSTGNASDFGDLTYDREGGGGNITDGSRCVFAGGWSYRQSSNTNIMDYVTSSSTGNATDFGDLQENFENMTGCADANIGRGFAGPGYNDQDQLEYITISSTGNASDFGTLTVNAHSRSATSDGIHGWWNGGGLTNVIEYIVTATLGNGTDWGDLHKSYYSYSSTCSVDAARVVQLGGYHGSPNTYGDWIEYWTTASAGNASDFGDLTAGRSGIATTGNGTRAVAMGGYESGGPLVDTMDYITIASTGNATDFGDMAQDMGWRIPNSGAAS